MRRRPTGRGRAAGTGSQQVAAAGVSIVRTGIADWNTEFANGQIAQERAKLDAAADARPSLLGLARRPHGSAARAALPDRREQLLVKVVNALKGHAALGAWKGVDEPRNRFRGDNWIRPAGLIRGYQRVKALDPNHPLVITHAPGSPAIQLTPYRPACDITGADIYPVSYPPGIHSGTDNTRPQRGRRRDEDAENRGRPQARLDDAADRVERRRPHAATVPGSSRASRACTTSGSWPTRRSSTAPADCPSSAAT